MSALRRVSFALAILLMVPACDSYEPGTNPLEDDLVDPTSCDASSAIAIAADGTYLRTHQDEPADPTAVDLAAVGAAAGSTLILERFGEYQYKSNDDPRLVRRETAGVFSASQDLRPTNQSARVVGAIEAGEDVVTDPTFHGNFPTDIEHDFEIGDRTSVTVPEGAQYLLITPIAVKFVDNVDADGDYRLCVTVAS